ncbi:MAG: tandem-95 repeat protein [Mycobacterium sp.]
MSLNPVAPAAAVPVPVGAAAMQPTISVAVAAVRPVAVNPIQASITNVITSVVRPVLSSLLGAFPGGPAESPLAWTLLAAARKQVGTTEATAIAATATPMTAAQPVAATVTNQPPTADVTWGRPDATTGKVLGQLSTSDPEGNKVAVGVLTPPSAGTLTYNAKTATFTYTPTTAQRFLASQSSATDTVTMTLGVTDGVSPVAVTVNIPVSPSPFYKSTDVATVTAPSAVATTSNRAYITSRDAGTVTIYDTIKNTVIATYQVGAAPDGIAVKSDGTRLYVSSSTNNTVTVIDGVTGKVKATLAVTNPTAITINPSGGTVYVANGSSATVTKISTSTNKVAGTVKLTAGLNPTELAVSSDGNKVYVASATSAGGNVSWFSSGATTATTLSNIAGAPIGLAISRTYPMLFVATGTGGITMVNTTTGGTTTFDLGQPLNGIALTNDGSALMITTSTGLLAALNTTAGGYAGVTSIRDATAGPETVLPGVALSPDGTQMFVTDADTNSVHVVSLVPPNTPPFSSAPQYSVSNPSTGALTGTVGVVDFDGDPLTYTVNTKPTKGKLVFNADGTYTYTPTSTARHAASVPGAPSSVTQDSFTITVSDGRNGTLTETVPVTIDPKNTAPTVKTTIGNPSTSTGVVKGTVASSDSDGDKRSYSVTDAPAKGAVTVTSSGSFTYTPNAAARSAATAPNATHDDKMDTFTVTVDDGHGGVVPVTVNVKIGAANAKPFGAKATLTNTDPRSGVVTGSVSATDTDGDTLTYTASGTTKGTTVVNADGSFTYTPTAAARLAASKVGASISTKSETITFTVSDGFGGTTTASVKVSIAPNPSISAPPSNVTVTVGNPSTAVGTVTGTVTASGYQGDPLAYSLGTGPASGIAKVTSTGQFTYTPNVDARYLALAVPGQNTDSFTVNISDPFGGTATATVNVTIAPPSASAIDQRATTIGVNTQQLYFYSQTDTDKALGLLKAAGVDTIRIMLPWAGVESTQGTYDWSAVDRMVNSANANGIKVLATVDSTPDWAAVPGQPLYQGQPANLTAFGDFMSQVATRYQGKVADYEIWNEPNYNGFWAPTPNAAQYTALLKVAYTAIKEADPNAVVIAAGVAAVAETPGGPAINPVTFLTEMYAAGAAGYFDALSFHPYQYGVMFSAGEGHAGMPIMQAEQLHAVMVANGDGNKKIWVTEYGEPTSEVSEDTQAAYIGDLLRTWRTLDYAGPAFIQALVDYQDPDPAQATMGLFHEDWTPKPALGVLEQVIAENAAIVAAGDAAGAV